MDLKPADNSTQPGKQDIQRRSQKLFFGLLPAVAAACIVLYEPTLTEWMQGRESALPVVMMLVLCAMLHVQLRRLLIITLCYGISFLALRDSQHILPLPAVLNYEFIEEARPAILYLIAALAAFAAISESLEPGSVRARRCYFGAAALYFSGLGVISCGFRITWQAVMLCVTGLSAAVAFVFAHRIIIDENEPASDIEETDETLQQKLEAAHHLALRTKEWQEPSLADAEPNDRDGTARGGSISPAPQ